jgi:hypothetical protein
LESARCRRRARPAPIERRESSNVRGGGHVVADEVDHYELPDAFVRRERRKDPFDERIVGTLSLDSVLVAATEEHERDNDKQQEDLTAARVRAWDRHWHDYAPCKRYG